MIEFRKVKKRIIKPIFRIFALWVVVIFLIQIAAPNPVIESMPENCPLNSGNCVRVALDGTSYRNNYLISPEISASALEVREVISDWFSEEKGGNILTSNYNQNTENYFLHAKDYTNFLYFPDDIYVNSGCGIDSNLTVVILQSQSRLGSGDIGVNFNRMVDLTIYLDQYSWSGNSCNFND